MGGHSGGEVASRVAVEAVAAHLHEALAREPAAPSQGTRANTLLAEAVQRANQAVRNAARRTREADMGTTVACVFARGDRAAIAHVGDSRVYRYRDHRLETLTDDHSLVAECVRSGYLSPDLASIFPYRHIVTRSLGADEVVEVDTRLLEPAPGDLLLLCSDGLSGVLEEEEIGCVLGGVRDSRGGGPAARRGRQREGWARQRDRGAGALAALSLPWGLSRRSRRCPRCHPRPRPACRRGRGTAPGTAPGARNRSRSARSSSCKPTGRRR